jgi:UDP:flavonoid glycosyltransferase YjiC (YdhE family)
VKRILFCVLDWGLGHATRSMPVIAELQRQGAEVFLASSGSAGFLLREKFPLLSYHELPAYSPRYPRRGSLTLAMMAQAPRLRNTIRKEHEEVEVLVKNLRLDAVISDNRYGCFTRLAPSIMLTHQPKVRLGPGWRLAERMVNAWLRSYLINYREVWVPDRPGSGLTDKFVASDLPTRYVGWLSRFSSNGESTTSFPLMAIVSGPDPQRSLFVNLLRDQLRRWPGRTLLVTGEPGKNIAERVGDLEVVGHLPPEQMEAELRSAGLVVARSGYSTVMDLIALGKRAVFVPTPGQPEQIHLANLLRESRIACCQDQRNFEVEELVRQSLQYRGFGELKMDHVMLESAIKQLLS